MNKKDQNLIENLVPYIIGYKKNFEHFNLEHISRGQRYNPLSLSSSDFVNLVYRMDEIAFGSKDMTMPRWVMFDCSVMPSAVYGYAIHKSQMSDNDLALYGETKCDYIPVSMYIAIPTVNKECWFGHNLTSLNNKMEMDLSGLGSLTKRSAIRALNIRKLMGATQWNSDAIFVHLKFGYLEVLSAYTPIHTIEETLSYLCEFKADNSVEGRKFRFVATKKNLIELQGKIEQSAKFIITKVLCSKNKIHEYEMIQLY